MDKTKDAKPVNIKIYDPTSSRTAEDADSDDVGELIKKGGCAEESEKMQVCFFETKDWRKCKDEIELFRKCWEKKEKNELGK